MNPQHLPEGHAVESEAITAKATAGIRERLTKARGWPEEPSPAELLRDDHTRLQMLFDEANAAAPSDEVFDTLFSAIETHLRQEEVLFPTLVRLNRSDVDAFWARVRQEIRSIRRRLHSLRRMPRESERFQDELSDLQTACEEHIDAIEQTLFPWLEEKLVERQGELSAAMLQIRKVRSGHSQR